VPNHAPSTMLVLGVMLVTLATASCTIKRPNAYLNTAAGRERMIRLCEQQLASQLPAGAVKRIERGRFDNDDAYGPAVYSFNAEIADTTEGRTRFVCIGEEDGRIGVTLFESISRPLRHRSALGWEP